jgi:fibronectin-binding autotransporter adhesin
VNVGGSASSANAAISGANTQVLTLTATNTYTGLTSVAGGSTLILAAPGTFSNAYTGGLTIGFNGSNGTVGTANISSGTSLTGVGAINVDAGTLNVASNLTSTAALLLGATGGTGTMNITAGTVNLKGISLNSTSNSTANLTLSGGVLNIGSGGIAALTSGNTNLNLGAATVGATANWSSNQNFNLTDSTVGTTVNTLDAVDGVTPRTITLSGTLSGSGLLNVTGTGKLYFNGSENSSGAVTVGTGATLGGSGSFSGATTIATGGSLEAGQLGAGSMTFNGGLTFNGSANVNIGTLAGYSSSPAIIDNSTLTANGSSNSVTINIANIVGASVGTPYQLITYAGGSIGGTGFSAFKLAPLPSRAVGTLSNTGTGIDLTINSFAYLIWNGASNLGNGWDTTTPNWNLSSGGTTTYIDSPSPDAVVFDDTASPSNTTVNLNTIVHPNAVTFNNNINNYTITGTGGINGSTGLMMTGTGIVILNTSNGFTGPVTINAGITSLQKSGALGASVGVTVASGATLQLQGGVTTGNVPLSITGTGAGGQNGVLVNSGGTNTYTGTVTLAGNSTISSDSGSLTLSSTTAITGSGNALTLTGAGNGTISSSIATGGGALNMTGSGTWSLNGINSFTGPTSITSGTLAVTNTGGLSSSSNIYLGTSNSGSLNITLHVGAAVNITSPITVSTPGTGTISLNATGATTATVSGAINLGSNLTINNTNTAILPSAYTGAYLATGGLNISSGITGSGVLTFTGGGVTLLKTGIDNYSGQTLITGNTLLEFYGSGQTDPNSVLNISAGSIAVGGDLSAGEFGGLIGSGVFAGATGGTGNGSNTIGYLNDASDNFSGVASGLLQITKTGSGMQIFSGSNTYTGSTTVTGGVLQAGVATVPGVSGAFGVNNNAIVSGGTLDLNSFNTSIGSLSDGGSTSGSVTLGSATLTITGSSNASFGGTISGTGGLVIKTSATQTLTGSNNTYSGSTNVSSGTLVVTTTGALPTGNNVSVNSGAMLVLDSQTTESSLNLLNINGNAVIHNGNLQTLSTAAQLAFNAGWNTSTGIASSAAAGNTTHLTALGIIQNDNGYGNGTQLYTSFEGQSVNDSDVLVKYTYYGDTDLNGKVDGSDYSRIDNAYLNNQNSSNAQLTGWFNGDFNYDGVIDGSDYTLIDNAYNSQGTQISAEVATPAAQIAETSAVPEPTTMGLSGIGAIGLLSRRRRRR